MAQEVFLRALPKPVRDHFALYGLDERKLMDLYGPLNLSGAIYATAKGRCRSLMADRAETAPEEERRAAGEPGTEVTSPVDEQPLPETPASLENPTAGEAGPEEGTGLEDGGQGNAQAS